MIKQEPLLVKHEFQLTIKHTPTLSWNYIK